METLREKCIIGITANEERCKEMVMNSIGLVTALNPYLGYENSSKIATEAMLTGKKVYDIILDQGLMDKKMLDEVLKPENMIKPRKIDLH
jgi:aspartate ammonia-lyase